MSSRSDRFAGKVILITGGAGGMGQAHARRFVAEGARVIIADMNKEAGELFADELQGAVAFVELEVSDEQSWKQAAAKAQQTFGPVTFLVNNAGIVRGGSVEDMDPSLFRQVIDVNLVGSFLGIQAVVPMMKRAGGGSIINISSVMGLAPLPALSAYCSSKHAIMGLTKVAALDLAKWNIRVNSVNPGIVDTPMLGKVDSLTPRRQPISRIGAPDEISNMVLFLASDEASFCTGASYVVDGGYLNVVGDE